jgi:MFS family permease
MLAFSILLALMRPEMGWIILIPIGVLMGINWGLFGASATSRVIEALPEEDKAIGSSMMNFFIYMGSTVGTALFAAFFSIVGKTGGTPIDMLDMDVFMAGFTPAMVLACVLSAICVVTAWIVKEKKPSGL